MARGENFIKIKMMKIITNLTHIVLYGRKITMIQMTIGTNVKDKVNFMKKTIQVINYLLFSKQSPRGF